MSNSGLSMILEESQSRIDEIGDHQRIRTQRNEGSHISKMPTELLSKVFLHLADIWPTIYTYENEIPSVQLEWATVLHVCRHWRDVANGYPQLWTDINLRSPDYALKLLQKAKSLPVSITIPPNIGKEMRDMLYGSLPELGRFRNLRISLDNSFTTRGRIIDILTYDGAPLLESLVLEGGPSSLPMTSISGLLWKGAPHLRSFELTTWYIPWKAPILTGLTSLKITNWMSRAGPGTWSDFFDALDRMQCLEELILHTRLPEAFGKNFEADRTVYLRHLHTFELKARIQDSETILKHLPLYASASVRFIWADPINPLSVADFITTLNLAWFCDPLQNSTHDITQPQFPSLHDLEISESCQPPIFNVSARWERTISPSNTLSNILQITLPSAPDAMKAMVASFSLSKLQSIKLAAPISTHLLDFLQDAPSLTSIHLTGDSVFTFFKFIFQNPLMQTIAPNVNPATVPPPDLHCMNVPPLSKPMAFMWAAHITFEDVDFSLSQQDIYPWYLPSQSRNFYDIKLFKFLQLRSRYMQPVHQVDIRNCKNISKAHIMLLQDVVPEVVWDGVGLFTS